MRVADEQNTCAYYRIKAVLLFPGQDAQKVGMGKDLYDTYPAAKAMMDAADAALGYSLTDIMFNGPDAELTRTCNCQPALYLHGLALYEILRSEVEIEPVTTAGLSLGEFTAHAAAGTFSMEDGLKRTMYAPCSVLSFAAHGTGILETGVAIAAAQRPIVRQAQGQL